MAKGGSQQQVVKNDPWIGQQPYLREGFERAQDDILNGPLPFAPMDPAMTRALDMQEQRALAGNPYLAQAQKQAGDTASGYYFNGPGMDRMRDYVMSSVRPGIDSSFASGGRYGSGLHAESMGKGVALGLAPFMNAERDRMMQAGGMIPALGMADYMDTDRLANVGAARQAQAQGELNAPYDQLQRYMGLIGGGYGGTQTTSGGQGSSPLLGALGGAGAGAGVASALGLAGPWGWGLAGLGGLAGAFG